MSSITIAIDGYSSCGKSTLARDLAEKMNYVYVDSGAMYRAVTLYFMENTIDFNDHDSVVRALERIEIGFLRTPRGNRTQLNGEDVEDRIREMRVSELVSPVAAVSAVRKALVRQQQKIGSGKGIVMDGRDIGTVVFPEAELKFFVTASRKVRTDRRYHELLEKGISISREEVATNLSERDRIDSTRADSPLTMATDAVILDNSNLSRKEQLAMALALARIRAGTNT